jgi:hypothetical protein
MMLRPSRKRRPEDDFFPFKVLLFAVGAGFALAGISAGRDWLVTVGIVALAVGVMLRLVSERRHRLAEDAQDADDIEDEGPGAA